VKKHYLLALLVCFSACGGRMDPTMQTQRPLIADRSLYERLGGLDAIKAVVDDLLANIMNDPVINARFANADTTNLKQKLVEQICAVSGGPCTYTGKSMEEAHAGMNIVDAEFDAMMGDLKRTLVRFEVPPREQEELLAALGGMRSQIVNK
jgi:hemoglobin